MKALSVRAPWWWAILNGKPVENRDWQTNVRGRVALHAGKYWDGKEIANDYAVICDAAEKDRIPLPWPDWYLMRLAGGCLVGTVEIVDCVRSHPSAFFFGPYGFVMRNPVALAVPVPVKGMLGFFEVDAALLAKR